MTEPQYVVAAKTRYLMLDDDSAEHVGSNDPAAVKIDAGGSDSEAQAGSTRSMEHVHMIDFELA